MRPPALQSHQRRQALTKTHREAARWNSGGARIDLRPFPPHPPITRAAPGLGETLKAGRVLIAFFEMGTRGEPQKPVDSVGCNYVPPHSTKRAARFARIKTPHFALFLPHFYLFLPHPCFLHDPHIYLSIYLFSEEKERNEGGKAGKEQSTLRVLSLHMYPHFFIGIHGFLWICRRLETQCWRGFQCFYGVNPQSTRGNALGGVELAVEGVCHDD